MEKKSKYDDIWYQLYAEKFNGKILYLEPLEKGKISQKRRIKYECSEGHIRESSVQSLQMGNWCLICARNASYSKIKKKNY